MTTEIREYPELGEIVHYITLDNGLSIYVMPKRGFKSYQAIFGTSYGGCDRRFIINGEKHETPAGIAHFLEHKMFDMPGPDGEIFNMLPMMTSMGAQVNAMTSERVTMYTLGCTSNFEQNLELMLGYVSTPYFTPESVAKEQGIIAQEILMGQNNPGNVAYEHLLKLLYKENSIRDTVAGTVESISQIDADTLFACHRMFYTPSNMFLAVVGDVDPEKIAEIATRVLPAEKTEAPQHDYGDSEGDTPAVGQYEEFKMDTGFPIFMGGAKINVDKPMGEEYLLNVLTGSIACACMLGSATPFCTKLYSEGMFLSLAAQMQQSPGGATLMVVGAANDPKKLRDAIFAEAERVGKSGVDAALFERIKKSQIGSMIQTMDSLGDLCMLFASAHILNYDVLHQVELLDKIKVEDINAFIAKYIKPERFALAVAAPQKKMSPAKQALITAAIKKAATQK
jgi:predicted Zn-dependent peptidase